jgi:hypothetical protein
MTVRSETQRGTMRFTTKLYASGITFLVLALASIGLTYGSHGASKAAPQP